MSNYLYAEMENNSFFIRSSGNLLGCDFNNIRVKIDTGCTHTTFPLSKVFLFNELQLKRLKHNDIVSNIPYMISYGVESGGLNHDEPVTDDEKMSCEAMKFKHPIKNFYLADYSLPNLDIHINYDRHGNILIGMDILSKFDIHIGLSQKTGKVTLIGVLKSQDDKSDYENALLEHFNLVKKYSALADGIRSLFSRNRRIIKEE